MTRFAIYSACLVAVNIGLLRGLVDFARSNVTASHVVLVPFVSVVLVYTNRSAIFSSVKGTLLPGLAVILAGVVLLSAGHLGMTPAGSLSLMMAGFVLAWIGGFVVFFGAAAARAAAFPLVFLLFMIPLPELVIGAATSFLKKGSSEIVATLFTLTGTPYHRQGFVFSLPAFVIEIADECSGIRSSIALMLTSLLAGDRFLASWWTKGLVLLAILPIAIVKNGIRIVALSLLATHVDQSFLTGQLHHEGGFVFFLLALGLMVPVFAVLRWLEVLGQNHLQRRSATAIP
ncbi:MAG TPA: exosortase/archaeosortase family protein [Vicinamibacterales bacterium]